MIPTRFSLKKITKRSDSPTLHVSKDVAASVSKALAEAAADAKKKIVKRSETPTSFVSKDVESLAEATAKGAAQAATAAKDEGNAEETIRGSVDSNSLIDREPAEEVKTKKNEKKSDFRAWLESSDAEIEVDSKKPKKPQEILGNMWLDFVETKVMPSAFCRIACGDFDDETTAASTNLSESKSTEQVYGFRDDDLVAFAKTSSRKNKKSHAKQVKRRKGSRY